MSRDHEHGDKDSKQDVSNSDTMFMFEAEDFSEHDEQKIFQPLTLAPKKQHLAQPLLVAVLCILFSFVSWYSPWRQYLWVSQHSVFVNAEYWRLLTALFVHADSGHLLSNAPLFLIFSWYLRNYYGFLFFPVLPFIAGLVTNLMVIAYYEPYVRLIGLSGLVHAMVGLWLVLYMRFALEHPWPQRLLRVTGFVFMMMLPSSFHANVSYAAHFIGFFVGVLLGNSFFVLAKRHLDGLERQHVEQKNKDHNLA